MRETIRHRCARQRDDELQAHRAVSPSGQARLQSDNVGLVLLLGKTSRQSWITCALSDSAYGHCVAPCSGLVGVQANL